MKNKNIYLQKSKFLNGAIKAINSKQAETVKKANQIIGDVESFEKEIFKKFISYS